MPRKLVGAATLHSRREPDEERGSAVMDRQIYEEDHEAFRDVVKEFLKRYATNEKREQWDADGEIDRETMLAAAQRLARRGGWEALAAKVDNAPRPGDASHPQFVTEVEQLAAALADAGDFHAGAGVRAAYAVLRGKVAFVGRDRALAGDIRAVCALVQEDAFRGLPA